MDHTCDVVFLLSLPHCVWLAPLSCLYQHQRFRFSSNHLVTYYTLLSVEYVHKLPRQERSTTINM